MMQGPIRSAEQVEIIEDFEKNIVELNATLKNLQKDFDRVVNSPWYNVFADMASAEIYLENKLEDEAFLDCEGAGNVGDWRYEQEFIVNDKHYVARLDVEYNRHDKTYYYIDCTNFTIFTAEELNGAS